METVVWVQTIVLAFTLIILYFYAAETAALRRETVRQTKLTARPLIVPVFVPEPRSSYAFRLQNIGSSSAFNVRVQPYMQDIGLGTIQYWFRPVEFIEPQASKWVEATQFLDDKAHKSELTNQTFYPKYATSELHLVIMFDDVEGRTYSIPVKISPSAHPGILDSEVSLGPITGSEDPTRNSFKKFIDRLFQWYP